MNYKLKHIIEILIYRTLKVEHCGSDFRNEFCSGEEDDRRECDNYSNCKLGHELVKELEEA